MRFWHITLRWLNVHIILKRRPIFQIIISQVTSILFSIIKSWCGFKFIFFKNTLIPLRSHPPTLFSLLTFLLPIPTSLEPIPTEGQLPSLSSSWSPHTKSGDQHTSGGPNRSSALVMVARIEVFGAKWRGSRSRLVVGLPGWGVVGERVGLGFER